MSTERQARFISKAGEDTSAQLAPANDKKYQYSCTVLLPQHIEEALSDAFPLEGLPEQDQAEIVAFHEAGHCIGTQVTYLAAPHEVNLLAANALKSAGPDFEKTREDFVRVILNESIADGHSLYWYGKLKQSQDVPGGTHWQAQVGTALQSLLASRQSENRNIEEQGKPDDHYTIGALRVFESAWNQMTPAARNAFWDKLTPDAIAGYSYSNAMQGFQAYEARIAATVARSLQANAVLTAAHPAAASALVQRAEAPVQVLVSTRKP
jgi:hypothetical protein